MLRAESKLRPKRAFRKSYFVLPISMALVAISPLRCYALFSVTTYSYESLLYFDNVTSVRVVQPKVVQGNSSLIYNKPMDNKMRGHQIASKAVNLATNSALSKKGFTVYVDDLSDLENTLELDRQFDPEIWEQVVGFSDAPEPRKGRLLPYKAPALIGLNSQGKNQVDALMFVQIFGTFATAPGSADGVMLEQSIGIAGAATTMAIGGFAVMAPAAYTEYDYKISIYDTRSGELIWYREGHQNRTDSGSVGLLSQSLEKLLTQHFPECKKPVATAKFKVKRSSMVQSANAATLSPAMEEK